MTAISEMNHFSVSVPSIATQGSVKRVFEMPGFKKSEVCQDISMNKGFEKWHVHITERFDLITKADLINLGRTGAQKRIRSLNFGVGFSI